MEVVPTGDGDDDGVVWFRCPQCQGFLPKLSGLDLSADVGAGGSSGASGDLAEAADPRAGGPAAGGGADAETAGAVGEIGEDEIDRHEIDGVGIDGVGFDGVGIDRVGIENDDAEEDDAEDDDPEAASAEEDDDAGGRTRGRTRAADPAAPEVSAEPVLEYAAMLAAVDPATAVPYRPWESYEVGQCVLHLAWDDCGVVVAKELLPGGRQVVKCWFQGAGVVRLIENAPR